MLAHHFLKGKTLRCYIVELEDDTAEMENVGKHLEGQTRLTWTLGGALSAWITEAATSSACRGSNIW